MGHLLKTVCQCGYESNELPIGAGFSSLETGLVYTVAYCDHCENVQSVALEDEPPACEACHQQLALYEDGIGKLSPGYKRNKGWHCPICKTDSLHFEWIGLWD